MRYPRSIMHPQFRNFTHLEAEEYLKEVQFFIAVCIGVFMSYLANLSTCMLQTVVDGRSSLCRPLKSRNTGD